MKLKRFLTGLMTTVMMFSVVACGGSSDEAKKISYNNTHEPPELNSVMTTSTGSGNVLRHIMEGLVTLDENDEPEAGVAEKWTVSEDKLTYTFNLRKGTKWSNGEEVTAKDFKYAWDQLFDASVGAKYAGTWVPLFKGGEGWGDTTTLPAEEQAAAQAKVMDAVRENGYKAVDDYTFEVYTSGPYDYMLGVLAFYNFLPMNEKAVEEAGGWDAYAKEADAMATNGPFTIDEWIHEDKIVMNKDDNYWQADKINLDALEFRVISDINAALSSFEANEIDVIEVTGEQAKQLREEGKTVNDFDDGSSWYFEYNTTRTGLKNVKIRKALTLAFDAQLFVNSIVLNESKPATSFVPTAIQKGEFASKVGTLIERPTDGNYDAVKAMLEEGLKEEGLALADFKPVMLVDDTPTGNKTAAFVQEQFKQHLGVELAIEVMTYKARIARMQSQDFDIVYAGWGPDYNDPMTFLDLFTTGNGNNHTGYSNARYDELVGLARAEVDTDKRTEYLLELEKIIVEDQPIGYIYNRRKDYVMQEGITGVVKTSFTDVDFRFADKK
ncbi:MAG: ABC transporter substrate-binding protein [Breznakia sp.]